MNDKNTQDIRLMLEFIDLLVVLRVIVTCCRITSIREMESS